MALMAVKMASVWLNKGGALLSVIYQTYRKEISTFLPHKNTPVLHDVM